ARRPPLRLHVATGADARHHAMSRIAGSACAAQYWRSGSQPAGGPTPMVRRQLRTRLLISLFGVMLVTSSTIARAQTAVDDQRLLAASDQTDTDWIMFGQDYRNQRFSSLSTIDRSNIAHLQPAWIFQSGIVGSHQTHPLVVDGVMYFTTPACDV